MAYRSFTSLSTRKSPAFRGQSIKLDGIGDYIDLQGEECGAFRHAMRHCTRLTSNDKYAPASWSFWVKFNGGTLNDVVSHHDADANNDMKHFILKTYAANLGYGTGGEYWNSPFIGLVSDGTDVRFAFGHGIGGAPGVHRRKIRRSTTSTVSGDIWYNIIVAFTGKSAVGTLFVNGVAQSLTTHYPSGVSSGELADANYNSSMPYFNIPYAPTIDSLGNPSQNEVNAYINSKQYFACYIGRNQSDYLQMSILDCAFWGRTELNIDDAQGIYSRQNIDQIQYHSKAGNYVKGQDLQASTSFKLLTDYGGGAKVTLTDTAGSETYLFCNTDDSQYNPLNNGDLRSDGNIQVITSGGGGTFSSTIAHTNFTAAINSNQPGIIATNGASNSSTNLQQSIPGVVGNTIITYPDVILYGSQFPGTGAVFSDIDNGYISDANGDPAPAAFTGGFDFLHAVWKFRGTRIDSSLNSALGATDNRPSEFNQDPNHGVAYLESRNDVPPSANWVSFLSYLPNNTLSALNNGGTYQSGPGAVPTDTI